VKQKPVNVIGAMLNQVLTSPCRIPKEIMNSFEERHKKTLSPEPTLLESIEFLVLAFKKNFNKIFICVDGLDECMEKCRKTMLESFSDVLKNPDVGHSVRLFLTVRHQVMDHVLKNFDLFAQPISRKLDATEEDIETYVSHRLDFDEYPECMDEELREKIREKIVKNSDGM
jgi:hypothetical protein